MDTFGFTKKKLLSLSFENQNRHIILWLSQFYQKLTTNRIPYSSMDIFVRQYTEILNWTEMKPFIKPASNDNREWLEILSDRIHLHRLNTGTAIRDYDLLKKIQTKIPIDTIPSSCRPIDFHCHLALDGLRSLFNVGSVFRICEASGFKSIILGNTLGKEHPIVQKTAMGAHKWVKQEKTADLGCTLLEKKKKGFSIIGVETIEGAQPYNDIHWEKKTIVVFGNEEYGISSHVMKTCDKFVHIPMFGRKNSLNVANAAAIICFQIAASLSTQFPEP